MWFTKNEKRVLKLLLENANLSDTAISNLLNITSQAVGRIRKKLEEEHIIKRYTLELDISSLGVGVFSLIKILSNPLRKNKNMKELEDRIANIPEVITLFRTSSGEEEHIILAGFTNMEELDKFVNEKIKVEDNWIVKEVIPLSSKSIIKNSTRSILTKMIDISSLKKDKDFNIVFNTTEEIKEKKLHLTNI